MLRFSERLKELRQEKGLSQRALARELKVSQAAIARWEAGLQIPTIEIAMVIAKYFGVSSDYLIGLED